MVEHILPLFTWVCLTLLAGGHRSLPDGVTCGNQFNNSADALVIPNPRISWASYRILSCDAPIFWLKGDATSAGQNLSFTALSPLLDRFASVRVSVLVIGPGLPNLTSAEESRVLHDALAGIPAGQGAVLFESPADQSSCAHLKSAEMSQASSVLDTRCHFHEPYGDSRSWVLLDETLVTRASGMHHFAVFAANGGAAAKVSFACCDWPEDFRTAYAMPDSECPHCGTQPSFPMWSSHFHEHREMANYSGFPAYEQCNATVGLAQEPTEGQCPNISSGPSSPNGQPESCTLHCSGERCHSHNPFGECTYNMRWIMPKPTMNGANVTSLTLYMGDKVRFSSTGDQWPHNLVRMASATHLQNCDWASNAQILTVEQVRDGQEITFDTAGTFYYSCKMTGHCEEGQKLTVEVKDSSEGMRCHDHAGANQSGPPGCASGQVSAYIIGDYGAEAGQCSQTCTSARGLAWLPKHTKGSCADAGFPEMISEKSHQPAGAPMPVQVRIMGNASSSCHCHSFEQINCDASGDALYNEHVEELRNYCGDIISGSTHVCLFKCSQPFNVMHLNYMECSTRPKHSLFLQVEATDKCHKKERAPFGAKCEQTTTVTGGFTMSVTNAQAFVNDAQAKYGVTKAVAGLANVTVSAVVVTLKLVSRRLESFPPPRLLSATGTVAASYTIATGGAVSATNVQSTLASVTQSQLNAAISAQVNSASYTTNILSITQPTITGGTPQVGGAVPGAYDGVWKGPPEEGASGFKGVEIGIIAACTAVVALIVGALASWKHEKVENAMEKSFWVTGMMIGRRPKTVVAITFFLGIVISGGMATQKVESDPAKLWVPVGSVSLDHSEYVKDNWPSNTNPTLLTVSPKDSTTGKNILTAENLQSMLRIHNKILSIQVDGSKFVEDSKEIADYTARYGGLWTFDGRGGTRKKCVQWGPTCAMQSVLSIFNYSSALITNDVGIMDRIAKWDAAPLNSIVPGLGLYKGFESTDVLGGVVRDGSGRITGAEVFSWNMFQQEDRQEVVIKYGNEADTGVADPITFEWEADAVCILGVMKEHPTKQGTSCPQPDGNLEYSGLFSRSFADEFGTAIRSDVAGVGAAYFIIIIYLFIMLGKRDTVHSMLAMSFGCLACVGLSYAGGTGLGALFGVKTNPLNNNIPFLILGLGVDDAFVLVAELTRHVTKSKQAMEKAIENGDSQEASIEHLIAETAKTGGASVLITSLTDALAFLVGASTALPALSAFCIYAGIAVILCFLFQIFLFLPLLALNLERTRCDPQRFDLFCCFKSQKKHEIDKPQGCCCCVCYPKCNPKDGVLPRIFGEVGKITVESVPGKAFTIFVWVVIFAVGIAGVTQVKKDFKLEWFFPEGSYTKKFIDLNDQYFSQGTTFSLYTDKVDFFASQAEMNDLTSYIAQKSVVKQNTVQNWWANFRPRPTVSPAGTTPGVFYTELWTWFGTSDFQNSIQWVDTRCNSKDNAVSATCDPTKGVAHTRISATLTRVGDGTTRFQTVNQMRLDINKIFNDDSGMKVFPFANDFLYWEENGIIDTELARNLIIAAGIVFIIICMLIPRPRIACIVSLGICMSIVELLGFMHWWGVTVNGTSTIYLLICLGLSVDYSAHIAHIFKESYGSKQERAIEAMTRIGPSVFHALFSTILAVIVLARSNTYVFEVFFKVLFLVTMIAGFKGLWLLPTVLSIVGGSQEEPQGDESKSQAKVEAKQGEEIKQDNEDNSVPEDTAVGT